jgi:hypothetical protein
MDYAKPLPPGRFVSDAGAMGRWRFSHRPFFLVSEFGFEGKMSSLAPDASADCSVALLFESRIEAFDQSVFVERLCQKADGAVMKRLLAVGLVGNGRNEDKRYLISLAAQVRLQFDAGHRRHADVGDHATGCVQLGRLQERRGGGKREDDISERSDEVVQAGANRCIIVNDRNHRCYGQNTVLHRGRDPRLLTRIAEQDPVLWYPA